MLAISRTDARHAGFRLGRCPLCQTLYVWRASRVLRLGTVYCRLAHAHSKPLLTRTTWGHTLVAYMPETADDYSRMLEPSHG